MGFLAPLYLIAGLAIGLPILFHLIQRRPRGETPFSSLMFLTPSPPKLVKRSRIEHWLLLLLRIVALLLLVFAFARPFARSASDIDQTAIGKKKIILLDTSASMRSPGAWSAAQKSVDSVLQESGPEDLIALITFDKSARTIVSLSEVSQLSPADRLAQIRTAMKSIEPGWLDTDLGQALSLASELFQLDSAPGEENDVTGGQIVLVTDLQSGSNLQQLDNLAWPEDVLLDVRSVRPDSIGNAGLTIMQSENDQSTSEQTRLQITNSASSQTELFTLRWGNVRGEPLSLPAIDIQVPAGSSEITTLSNPPAEARSVILGGDNADFDNTVYFAQSKKENKEVLFVGTPATEPADNLLYFLDKLPLSTSFRTIQIVSRPPNSTQPLPTRLQTPLVVTDSTLAPSDAAAIRTYLEEGGTALVVLDRPIEPSSDRASPPSTTSFLNDSLNALLNSNSVSISEAKPKDYFMLERIDFKHPLVAPLDDPRFSDFTKIRIWNHRVVQLPDDQPPQLLASFDDDTPAWMQWRIGKGTLWILATGWQPAQSQLALSSKFVPLMLGMLKLADPAPPWLAAKQVGDLTPITLSSGSTIQSPSGSSISSNDPNVEWDEPGVYLVNESNGVTEVAVNLAATESITEPLDQQVLTQRGVKTGKALSNQQEVELKRQMRSAELENNQQWWRWLLMATIAILVLEVLLGGRFSRTPTTVATEG